MTTLLPEVVELLARHASHTTGFSAVDSAVTLLSVSGDIADVRVTEQRFGSSGRTVLVASGPALQTEVLPDLLGDTLDADRENTTCQEGQVTLTPYWCPALGVVPKRNVASPVSFRTTDA